MASFFTWWHGATLGTRIQVWWRGRFVGKDDQGNAYYEEKKLLKGRKERRRWVIFNGPVEASRVPAEWHAWLHHIVSDPPTIDPPHRQTWEQDHQPNMTGTPAAYRPQGSLAGDGVRAEGDGDYEAWEPDGADAAR